MNQHSSNGGHSNAPQLSVVLPTYNRANLLERAVSSVMAQRFPDWELLVVNDGVDDVIPTLTAFSDSRIRVLQTRKNEGASAARNMGIGASRGNIIAFLDDDDEYHDNYLSSIDQAFREQPLDFVWTGIRRERVTSSGRRVWEERTWSIHSDTARSLDFLLEIGSCGLAVRRSCFEHHGLFDVALRNSEDRDLLFRLVSCGCRYAALRQILVTVHVQRRQGLSEWKNDPARAWASACDDAAVIARHRRLLASDIGLRRTYLSRLARKYYRAGDAMHYRQTLRELQEIGRISFKQRLRDWALRLRSPRALWNR